MSFKQKAVKFLTTGCFLSNISFASGTFDPIPGLSFGFFWSKIDLSVAVNSDNIFKSYESK